MVKRFFVSEGHAITFEDGKPAPNRADKPEKSFLNDQDAILSRIMGADIIERKITDEDRRECASLQIPGYQILEKLGEGADATTYHVKHNILGDVKAKVFHDPLDKIKKAMTEEGISLEDRIKRRISLFDKTLRDKSFVTQLYEVGTCKHPLTGNKTIYLISDYVDGGAIEIKIGDNYYIRPDIYDTFDIGLIWASILAGLRSLHGANLIHKDIKGSNILVSRNHLLVLIDDQETITYSDFWSQKSRFTMGSDRYAAPEVLRDSRQASAKSDLYSAGVCLLHMLTHKTSLMVGINNIIQTQEYYGRLDEMLKKEGFDNMQRNFFKTVLAHGPQVRKMNMFRDLRFWPPFGEPFVTNHDAFVQSEGVYGYEHLVESYFKLFDPDIGFVLENTFGRKPFDPKDWGMNVSLPSRD